MAITGTGTEQDPYIVTTYDELVEKAAESGKFVKIGNDINILDEYPDGDMPQLVLNAVIDGDDKIVSNWYSTVERDLIAISNANARVNSLKIRNLYTKLSSGVVVQPTVQGGADFIFNNCEISGVIDNGFTWDNGAMKFFNQCSINLKCTRQGVRVLTGYGQNITTGKDCFIKVHCSKTCAINYYTTWENCYLEITADDAVKSSVTFSESHNCFDNCVIDSYLTTTETVSGYTAAISIINSTHAPNYSVASNLALVDDIYWLDVEYLANEIGFNAG